MKEATGELSGTVITVVAIAAVLTIFTIVLLPAIKNALRARTYCASAVCGECDNGKATCSYYDDNMNLVDGLVCDCGAEQ